MNKKTLLVALCFLTGTAEVSARRVSLSGTRTNKELNKELNDELLQAALAGNIKEMRRLIALGADVNSQQFDTYILQDSIQQHYGLDIYIKNQTILIVLLSKEEVDLDVLKFLINEAGANPNLTDSQGNNAFTLTRNNVDKELSDILHGKTK